MELEIDAPIPVPFAEILREMDLEFLVLGEYGITVEEAAKFVHHDHFVFLDLRGRGKK